MMKDIKKGKYGKVEESQICWMIQMRVKANIPVHVVVQAIIMFLNMVWFSVVKMR